MGILLPSGTVGIFYSKSPNKTCEEILVAKKKHYEDLPEAEELQADLVDIKPVMLQV